MQRRLDIVATANTASAARSVGGLLKAMRDVRKGAEAKIEARGAAQAARAAGDVAKNLRGARVAGIALRGTMVTAFYAAKAAGIAFRTTLKAIRFSLVRLGAVGKRVFSGIARGIGKLSAVGLRGIRRSFVGLALGLTGIAVAGAAASGSYDKSRKRLEALTGSVSKAAKIFSETVAFANVTPFETKELVDARIILTSFGQTGIRALRAVGNAAFVADRQINDVVAVIAGLETEPLRRLGITFKNELASTGKGTFTFLDKAGKQVTLVANGFNDARQKLIEAFEIRFAGSLKAGSETIPGLLSTIRGKIGDTFAVFGDAFREDVQYALNSVIQLLDKIKESRVLIGIGKAFGTFIREGTDYLIANGPKFLETGVKWAAAVGGGARVLADTFNGIRKVFSEDGIGGLAPLLRTAVESAVGVLEVGVVESLKAAGSVAYSIGKVIAEGLLDKLSETDLGKFIGFLPSASSRAASVGAGLSDEAVGRVFKTTVTRLPGELRTALEAYAAKNAKGEKNFYERAGRLFSQNDMKGLQALFGGISVSDFADNRPNIPGLTGEAVRKYEKAMVDELLANSQIDASRLLQEGLASAFTDFAVSGQFDRALVDSAASIASAGSAMGAKIEQVTGEIAKTLRESYGVNVAESFSAGAATVREWFKEWSGVVEEGAKLTKMDRIKDFFGILNYIQNNIPFLKLPALLTNALTAQPVKGPVGSRSLTGGVENAFVGFSGQLNRGGISGRSNFLTIQEATAQRRAAQEERREERRDRYEQQMLRLARDTNKALAYLGGTSVTGPTTLPDNGVPPP